MIGKTPKKKLIILVSILLVVTIVLGRPEGRGPSRPTEACTDFKKQLSDNLDNISIFEQKMRPFFDLDSIIDSSFLVLMRSDLHKGSMIDFDTFLCHVP